ncbi:hypothetical protein [Armatimonas rosea]|uniref:Uncharacterized protein n=1 Tax=Armatimonas rosea TaxID=685828 RepID=A0A7W9W5J0_ARMRO|nr:hypothetical protein [Armatimonas rosea]MBB6048960.1 hypothetical protein [Armatimonas rosea]
MKTFLPVLLLSFLSLPCQAQYGGFAGGGAGASAGASAAGMGAASTVAIGGDTGEISGQGRGGELPINGTAVFFTVLALAGVTLGGILIAQAKALEQVGVLKIVSTPPGEAPAKMREAWVGVKIPLRRTNAKPIAVSAFGVLSRKAENLTEQAYAVPGAEAIEALVKQSPAAAVWWCHNVPEVRNTGYLLIFPQESCQVEK